jgi:hypothetical protein
MIEATISRVRMRDLARPGRSRPGVGDLVASIISRDYLDPVKVPRSDNGKGRP